MRAKLITLQIEVASATWDEEEKWSFLQTQECAIDFQEDGVCVRSPYGRPCDVISEHETDLAQLLVDKWMLESYLGTFSDNNCYQQHLEHFFVVLGATFFRSLNSDNKFVSQNISWIIIIGRLIIISRITSSRPVSSERCCRESRGYNRDFPSAGRWSRTES